jgi:hypothetical protein
MRGKTLVPSWSNDPKPCVCHGVPIKVGLAPFNGFSEPAQGFYELTVGGRGLRVTRREDLGHLIKSDLFAPW